MAFLAWIAPVLFLDTLIYVSGVAMLAAAYVWPLPAVPQKSPIDRFEIFAPGRKVFVPMEKIIAFVASGDGVDVLLVDGSRLYHSERIGKVEERLPTGLIRIHRSALIALDHAKDLKSEVGSKYTLGLTDGSALPVSRQKVKALRAALTDR